ncbi:MAG: hypothetical protein AD073_000321 [Mycoplasmataceae bacterium]|nr:MAG: hypothetical protein AD073_000321 [Mycoplasmataceae bacterium]
MLFAWVSGKSDLELCKEKYNNHLIATNLLTGECKVDCANSDLLHLNELLGTVNKEIGTHCENGKGCSDGKCLSDLELCQSKIPNQHFTFTQYRSDFSCSIVWCVFNSGSSFKFIPKEDGATCEWCDYQGYDNHNKRNGTCQNGQCIVPKTYSSEVERCRKQYSASTRATQMVMVVAQVAVGNYY